MAGMMEMLRREQGRGEYARLTHRCAPLRLASGNPGHSSAAPLSRKRHHCPGLATSHRRYDRGDYERTPAPSTDTCTRPRHDWAGAGSRGAQACVKRALEAVRDAAYPRSGRVASASRLSPVPPGFRRGLCNATCARPEASPHCVVQRLRLEAARRTLHAGEVSSVLDAALRHGFGHPGRFAAIYARAFGEPPSATLRSSRAIEPATALASGTRILLRALEPISLRMPRARGARADDLAIALSRTRDLVLLSETECQHRAKNVS